MKTRTPLNAILENIRSALNVGAIFRTSDAVLLNKLILSGITPYPPHNRIPKTALGAIETVPWVHEPNAIKAIKEFSDSNIVAVELTNKAVEYTDYIFKKPTTLIFGNEISGVSKESLEMCDAVIKIPMYGTKESLNVATSFGIIVYEIMRQWKND
jgi:23S rRNA (guanosine2251-2'-O)-methyltransferase